MSNPTAAREALIVEAIGEASSLIDAVSGLTPVVRDLEREIHQASAILRDNLAAFESRMAAITEGAKTKTVRYLAAHTEQAARRCADEQTRAMADAARVAFGAQVGSSVAQLRDLVQPLVDARQRRWEAWLTHTAAAMTAAAATWVVILLTGRC